MRTCIKVDDFEDGAVEIVDDGARFTGVTVWVQDAAGGQCVVISKPLALALANAIKKVLKGQGYRAEREGWTTSHNVAISSEFTE